uniref:Uncharacterized protein n=1 Tax=Hyaloperonospora arabidopsidis (strain Emoy2) TaxID=559515 RepID=M4BT86_HYAAE
MANLGVVDAWRIHFDTKRLFTGPVPRKNRLYYILMSESFSNQFYGDSWYFFPQHAGDHLAHSVSFRSGSQLHGRGYWKLPRYLLEYPTVVSAIETEAELVRDALRLASNPGKVWETWRKTIKKQLQAVQKSYVCKTPTLLTKLVFILIEPLLDIAILLVSCIGNSMPMLCGTIRKQFSARVNTTRTLRLTSKLATLKSRQSTSSGHWIPACVASLLRRW